MKFEVTVHVHLAGADEVCRIERALAQLLERINHMPTVTELKAAVTAAVGEEAQQVADRLKALEDEVVALKDQIANGQPVTQADIDEVIAGIRGIFTPA